MTVFLLSFAIMVLAILGVVFTFVGVIIYRVFTQVGLLH